MFVSRAIQLERRPFGHDLVALYNAAVAGGMTLNTPDAKEFIEWINEVALPRREDSISVHR